MPMGRVGGHFLQCALQIGPQGENVTAIAHGDCQADRRLSVDAKKRLRRVCIGAPNLCDIAEAQDASVDDEIDIPNVLLGFKCSRHAKRQPFVSRMDRSSGTNDVLCLQRSDKCGAIDAKAGEFLHRKFDEYPFVLGAQNFNLGHVRDLKKPRANILDMIAKITMRETIGRETEDYSERVTEIVVKSGSHNSGR